MTKFRKKPVEIEAYQFDGTYECADAIVRCFKPNHKLGCEIIPESDAGLDFTGNLLVVTTEGVMKASKADWIIKGIKGEYYPCKPDVFDATYEPAAEA